jgi:5-methylcytosine-specific restriction endonuclease McrA
VKRTPLNRKTPLRSVPQRKVPKKLKPGRAAEQFWHAQKGTRCVGCGGGKSLTLHHVCYRQHVRRHEGDIWDVRNGLTLCAHCHAQHHARAKPIPLAYLPDAALEFAF